MMSSFLAVFRKEVLHIRRNRGVLIVTVMMPVMQMLLFGFIDQTGPCKHVRYGITQQFIGNEDVFDQHVAIFCAHLHDPLNNGRGIVTLIFAVGHMADQRRGVAFHVG